MKAGILSKSVEQKRKKETGKALDIAIADRTRKEEKKEKKKMKKSRVRGSEIRSKSPELRKASVSRDAVSIQ